MKYIIYILTLFISLTVFSQNAKDHIREGNKQYKEKKYEDKITITEMMVINISIDHYHWWFDINQNGHMENEFENLLSNHIDTNKLFQWLLHIYMSIWLRSAHYITFNFQKYFYSVCSNIPTRTSYNQFDVP